MTDDNILLLKLISENKSLNEISSILGLTNKQLFTKLSTLRNNGYLLDREYSYNGDIYYSFHNPFIQNKNIINVKSNSDVSTITAMVISDTHLGHINDNINYLDSMYDYCSKEGINIVLHAGDIYEGIYESRKKQSQFDNAHDQISYGLKKYPYDKNILNFVLLGNHDATFITETGLDLYNILMDKRHDLIPIGYGQGDLYINDFKITMRHPIPKVKNSIEQHNRILLLGHSHAFSINNGPNSLVVHIPTLSNVDGGVKNTVPSMIKMQLEIKNNTITSENFVQFIFDSNNNPICIGDINYHISITSCENNIENNKIIPNIIANTKTNLSETTEEKVKTLKNITK